MVAITSTSGVKTPSGTSTYNVSFTVNNPSPVVTVQSTLVAKHSNKCMSVTDDSLSNIIPIIQRNCDNSKLVQTYEFIPSTIKPNVYQLKNVVTGKCLSVRGGNTADGTQLIQYSCVSSALNQLFERVAAPEVEGSYYQLVAQHSLKCMEVSQQSTAEGAAVLQYPCQAKGVRGSSGNQLWKIADAAQNCDYYVATTGSDSNTGTDLNSPFKTPKFAIQQLSAGKTLCIRGGTYPALKIVGKSGTAAQPITIRNYSNERPILDRSVGFDGVNYDGFRCKIGTALEPDCAVLTFDSGSSYIIIDGLEITDSDSRIADEKVYNLNLDTNTSNLNLVKQRVEHNGIRAAGSSPIAGIVIRNTEIHHVWRTGISGRFQNSVFENNNIPSHW